MTVSAHIVPASHGLAIAMKAGERARIINPAGSQVADAWVLSAADPAEYSAMEHTRSVNSSVFVERSMQIMSNLRRAMMTMVEDTTPGRHDTQLCPCSTELYHELGCAPGHRSCTANFQEAITAQGLSLPFTPASLNLFMNVPIYKDGSVDRLPPVSRPGDYITLRAEIDLWLVLSACPQDVTPINGTERRPQDLMVEILPPAEARS